MHRVLVLGAALAAAAIIAGPAAAGNSSVAALQVALRAHGQYPAAVDGVPGPLTLSGLTSFQRAQGLPTTGRVGPATRSAFGSLGRPLLGQRELGPGAVGWDVSSLEFRLIPFGLRPAAVDGRFSAETSKALAAFQAKHGLTRRRDRRDADLPGTRRQAAGYGATNATGSPNARRRRR